MQVNTRSVMVSGYFGPLAADIDPEELNVLMREQREKAERGAKDVLAQFPITLVTGAQHTVVDLASGRYLYTTLVFVQGRVT